MRQRNGSFWGIAVLAGLLGLLVLSGSAVAQVKSEGDPREATDSGASEEGDDAAVEVRGAGREGASEEGSQDVEAAGSEEDGSGGDDPGDRDCADFDSQGEAQDFFEEQGGADGGNPDRLDADGDGQACEDFDFGDDFPEGGVETGLGGVAAGPSGGSSVNVPLAAGGTALALLSLGLAALALRRRA